MRLTEFMVLRCIADLQTLGDRLEHLVEIEPTRRVGLTQKIFNLKSELLQLQIELEGKP